MFTTALIASKYHGAIELRNVWCRLSALWLGMVYAMLGQVGRIAAKQETRHFDSHQIATGLFKY